MSEGNHPPRMVLKQNKDGLVEAVSLSFIFMPFPQGAHEYLSLAEHSRLLSEALSNKPRPADSIEKLVEGLKKRLRKIKTISRKYEGGMGSTAAVFEMEDQADKALALLERLEK